VANVAVIADSMSCLPRELAEQYGIGIVPLSIAFQGQAYRDWIDISPTEAYKLFLQEPEAFTTSPASPGDFLEAYKEASQRAKNILCVTLSARLSTGCDMARVAQEDAKRELPGISIAVVDSQTVTAAEGFIALAAARAAMAGKTLAQVTKIAEEVRGKVSFVCVLDTIRHVYRTGRIPKIAAQAASVLNIKPILSSSSGLVRFIGATRNMKHGIERLLQIMKTKVGRSPVHVAVMHAFAPEEAEKIKKRVAAEFNCAELWVTEFSPVMGYATGTGTLGLAFYKEEKE
jgi:DegV family protein with EDD domain